MNLKIYAPLGTVTIGNTEFTNTELDLVNLPCLSDENCWNLMFNKVKDGHLEIKVNGNKLTQLSTISLKHSALSYMSRLIQKQINGKEFPDFPKLEEDWLLR